MKLSKEEKIMLKSNLELINEWVDGIKGDVSEHITIPIHHEYLKMSFNINEKGCYLSIGLSDLQLTDKDNDENDKYYYLKVLSNNTTEGIYFISNWRIVRQKIEQELVRQRKALDNLRNFKL